MIRLAKKCFTILLVAGLCLAFLPSAEARPHLPRKAAKGAKAAARYVGSHFPRPFSCN